MARKRVGLAFIPNDSARRATFKKRRKGLMKKVRELSILCDVQSCAIVFAPCESTTLIWPSPHEASGIIDRFLSLSDQAKKTLNQELLMEQRISKAEERLKRIQIENQSMEYNILLNQCLLGHRPVNNLSMENLTSLLQGIDVKIKAIHKRMETLTDNSSNQDIAANLEIDTSMALLPTGSQELVPHSLAGMVDMRPKNMDLQVLDGELGYFDPSYHDLLMKRQEMVMYNPQVFVPQEDAFSHIQDMVVYNPQVFVPQEDGFPHYLPPLAQFPCSESGGSSTNNFSLLDTRCFQGSYP